MTIKELIRFYEYMQNHHMDIINEWRESEID